MAHYAGKALLITPHGVDTHLHILDPSNGELAPDQGEPGTTREEIQQLFWSNAVLLYNQLGNDQRINTRERCRIIEDTGLMAANALIPPQQLDASIRQHLNQSVRKCPAVWQGVPTCPHGQLENLRRRLQEPYTTYEEAVAVTRGKLEVNHRRLVRF